VGGWRVNTDVDARNRAGWIKWLTAQACVSLVVAAGFAVLDRMTDLNGSVGMWAFIPSFVVAVGSIIWLRWQQGRDERRG